MSDNPFCASARLSRRTLLRTTAGATAAVAATGLGFPAILKAQQETVRIGHLTPLTGFLGQLGVYGQNAAKMAVEEINEAGGVLGRKVELLTEDSVNPGTAVTKTDQLIGRDKVVALLGEISSASALAIGEAAARQKTLYINTGSNSDALRGSNCNRYMFHVEGCNTMYTKTIGQWQLAENLVKGSKWYFLTADYAFGHDLRKVSQRFYTENGGTIAGDELVPTNSVDFSAYILNIRQAQPDMIYLNLAGVDQTNFLKQYSEYGLDIPLTGGVMDTGQFWGAGLEALSGYWQSLWYHGLDIPASQAFTKAYMERHQMPPENQAWGDYVAVKILAKAMNEANSTASEDLVKYLEGGAKFDILKAREGSFRDWDHQLLQEMYIVKVKEPAQSKDQWDIFDVVEAVPGAEEDLELIQPTKEENPCNMG
jgi:branched-chain amino acid transport system substrate-binding protein